MTLNSQSQRQPFAKTAHFELQSRVVFPGGKYPVSPRDKYTRSFSQFSLLIQNARVWSNFRHYSLPQWIFLYTLPKLKVQLINCYYITMSFSICKRVKYTASQDHIPNQRETMWIILCCENGSGPENVAYNFLEFGCGGSSSRETMDSYVELIMSGYVDQSVSHWRL